MDMSSCILDKVHDNILHYLFLLFYPQAEPSWEFQHVQLSLHDKMHLKKFICL